MSPNIEAPREWAKYKIMRWQKEVLELEEFRKGSAQYYESLGCKTIRYDTKENFLADLKSENIPVFFE